MRTLSSLLLMLAALLYGVPLCAQAITGDLTINVTDPNGAATPDATLALTNTQEGAVIAGRTNGTGSCTFNQLKPGIYSLKVSVAGFQEQRVKDISIQLAQRASVDVKLTLGTVNESVTVSAGAATLLNTDSATVGQVLQQHAIQELPLNGRNFIQLAQLSTGAAPVGTGNSPATSWTGRSDSTLSIAGLRESDVSYLVNGIETRNARFGNAGIHPSPDAIQEFGVQRSFFTAEYGESAAIVNTAIKSGTNDLHIAAFDLIRNRNFDANNFFANSAGQGRPAFSQNNFGATASGPVYLPKLFNGRNKLFFMFNYEGLRQREGLSANGTYPSTAQLAGNLADNSAGTGLFPTSSPFCRSNPTSQHCVDVINPATGSPFPGNVIPATLLNGISQKAIPFIPIPNVAVSQNALNFPTLNTFASPKLVNDFDQYNIRLDYQLSSADSLYGSYSSSNESQFRPAIQPVGGLNYPIADHLWTLTYVRTLTPTIVNEFRFGHNDSTTFQVSEGANGPNYAANTFGLKNTSSNPFDFGVPGFGISGFSGIGSSSEAIGADDENFQYVDNLSITRGKHNFKVGVQIMHLKYFEITDFSGNPSFQFTGQFTTGTSGIGLADFLLGDPYQASGAFGDSSQNMVTNSYGAYVEDNWKILPKLTLNLGLRYEFAAWPREVNGRAEFFDTAAQTTVIAGHGVRPEIVDPDYKNLAPRVGLAYQVNQNTVLRAGGGIYYATDNFNELQFEINGAPFYQSQTLNSNPNTPTLSLNDLLPSFSTSPNTSPFTFNRNNRTPYISQWTFDIQHTFGAGNFFELGYTGSTGQRLPQRYNLNAGTIDPSGAVPLQQRVPYPNFGFILFADNIGWSSYQAFTARYEHRFRSGLYVLGSYTWQNALDVGNTDDFSMISRDFKTYDKGHSDYDVPQRFVLSYMYELPIGRGKALLGGSSKALNALLGGWQVNGITTFSAGQYHTIGLNRDWLNLGAFSTSVPNVIGDPSAGRTVPSQYFNASAFAFPATHIEGNAGRNQFEVPGIVNWDASLFKNTAVTERFTAQLRLEAFNLLNHTQYGVPHMTWPSPTFGQITSTLVDSRRLQVGLRLTF
jgi:outer membrane receptor protein involved in Fe transport